MSHENVTRVRHAFEAAARGDVEGLVALCDPEIELRLRGAAEEPVHYSGHEGLREVFADMAESWESVEMVAQELRDLGDRVLVLGVQRGRGKASGAEVEMERGWIVDLRDGKATGLHSYNSPAEALEAAGLSP